jgi:hypothetical protein
VSSLGTDVVNTLWLEQMPTGGGAYVATTARGTATGDYRARLKIQADGTVLIGIVRVVNGTETLLATQTTVSGLRYTAGTRLDLRVQATGSSPTTVRSRVWVHGTTEPTAWQQSVTIRPGSSRPVRSVCTPTFGVADCRLSCSGRRPLSTPPSGSDDGAPGTDLSAVVAVLTTGAPTPAELLDTLRQQRQAPAVAPGATWSTSSGGQRRTRPAGRCLACGGRRPLRADPARGSL